MPDKKLTDSEIVKAFKICNDLDEVGFCKDCPHEGVERCIQYTNQKILDLINRLQAENKELVGNIDRLKEENEHYSHNVKEMTDSIRNYQKALEQAKAEIERLKAKCENTQIGYNFLKADFEETEKRNQDLVRAFQSYKAEAYKEVFEKLKDKSIVCKVKLYGKGKFFPCLYAVTLHDINRLKKELVGEDNAEEKE